MDKALAQTDGAPTRDPVADQILRETLLTVSSDWPFMVSKDSAADYARYRAHLHAHATREIADALASGRRYAAERLADGLEPRRRTVRRAGRPAAAPVSRHCERACRCADTLPRAVRTSRAPMKILMVSWEYPPVVIGGLGRHVYQLATALAAEGHDVVVLSRQPCRHRPGQPPHHRRACARACG